MREIARLYGKDAMYLEDGQLLQVSLISIEGRVVAILNDEITMKVRKHQ